MLCMQFYNLNILQVCFLVIILHLHDFHTHGTNLKLLRRRVYNERPYLLLSWTLILLPRVSSLPGPEIMLLLLSRVKCHCCATRWGQSSPNITFGTSYFSETINLIIAFLKHHIKFKINFCTFFLFKSSNSYITSTGNLR